jgi:hypothetical protein
VGFGDEREPLVAVLEVVADPAVGAFALGAPAEHERPGIAGVVQHLQDPVVAQWRPGEGALVRAGADPQREQHALGGERLDGGPGGSGAGEGGEQVPDRLLDAGVGVKHGLAGRVVDEADRQRRGQLAAAALDSTPPRSRARSRCSSASYADLVVMPTGRQSWWW